MDVLELITTYLEKLDLLNEETQVVLDDISKKQSELVFTELNNTITLSTIQNILCEKYNLNRDNIKSIESSFRKNQMINMGRNSKTALKKYLDYRTEIYFEHFLESFNQDTNQNFEVEELQSYLLLYEEIPQENINLYFIDSWNEAETLEYLDRIRKKSDFLLSLVSNLVAINKESISLKQLFNSNVPLLPKVFSQTTIKKLEDYCSNEELLPRDKAIKSFYKMYTSLLKEEYQDAAKNKKLVETHLNQYYIDEKIISNDFIKDRGSDIQLLPTEEYEMVYFEIDQYLYNRFNNKEKFLNHVLFTIKQCYRVLANEKVLSVKVENIYDLNNLNLKWEILSMLTIYAEKFIEHEETGLFYKPEEIAFDMLSRYNLQMGEISNDDLKECKNLLKKYYKNTLSIDELYSQISIDLDKITLESYLNDFRYANYGFDYNDTIILNRQNMDFPNGELQNIVQNTTELLVIFYKYRADQRRIPCPSCGSIHISGNSYPSVNNRSWECKSPYCIDRSKSNRGKRYSKKSTFMQQGALAPAQYDRIPKELIAKWRRDIVSIETDDEIEEMLVKYFSFTDEKLLFINTSSDMGKNTILNHRKLTMLSSKIENGYVSNTEVAFINDEISFFNSGRFINHFDKVPYRTIEDNLLRQQLSDYLQEKGNLNIIEGHSAQILSHMSENILTAAVTSPPYYNAREYSQWANFYLYSADMYRIIQEVYRTLKPGGIFLYNIADIADNENTIVKSTMGNKKLALGAYTIYLFLKAGFEIIENMIWDKGEPQSNRQKNDGKFTPHYQKPLNAYEHMFIFKKPGAPLNINNEKINDLGDWSKNIVRFSPVIKINSKGENLLGHTAPFPEDIPQFAADLFAQNDSDIILDPFSGSGTSALIAAQNNIGLGIELSPVYADLSVKRCEVHGLKTKIFKQTK